VCGASWVRGARDGSLGPDVFLLLHVPVQRCLPDGVRGRFLGHDVTQATACMRTTSAKVKPYTTATFQGMGLRPM
jgi:hypothetical protein